MARYDLFRNGDGYLLDVQSDLLDVLNTRVVVPLLPDALAPKPARRLNPVFQIEGGYHVMMTQYLAAVPASELKEKRGTLAEAHDDIVTALDMLFQGF